jgi:hypothetical protein
MFLLKREIKWADKSLTLAAIRRKKNKGIGLHCPQIADILGAACRQPVEKQ